MEKYRRLYAVNINKNTAKATKIIDCRLAHLHELKIFEKKKSDFLNDRLECVLYHE